MLAATHQFGEPHVAGGFVGLIIGFVIVVVVVAVVGAILSFAQRIGSQAQEAVRALEAAQSTTRPLNELDTTNAALKDTLRGAQTARQTLGG